jgi:sterol desaturase/sphingolipid hydroxylase (fatty acid hydroxylase superfamily)
MEMVAVIIRVGLFPFALGLAMATAYWADAAGFPTMATVGLTSLVGISCVALGELLLPFQKEWSKSRGDIKTDIFHSLISSFLGREVFRFLWLIPLIPMAGALAKVTPVSVWPEEWPLALQVILAAVISEFGIYWAHRVAHEKEFFWRLHSTHHSVERLYWLNAGRDHPLGVLWIYTMEFAPLILLGCPELVMLLFFTLEAVHGLFQHGNVDVRLGPLNWIFSGPELHRWHHSSVVEESNTNYGATLILWDILFGTRFHPRDRQLPASLGIPQIPTFPKTFLGQLRVPFQWVKMKEGAVLE